MIEIKLSDFIIIIVFYSNCKHMYKFTKIDTLSISI